MLPTLQRGEKQQEEDFHSGWLSAWVLPPRSKRSLQGHKEKRHDVRGWGAKVGQQLGAQSALGATTTRRNRHPDGPIGWGGMQELGGSLLPTASYLGSCLVFFRQVIRTEGNSSFLTPRA